jgi:cysteine desulfuration protein SufE
MNSTQPTQTTLQKIPPRLQEIIEDFQWCEGRDKLELLLQFAEDFPSLPNWLQGQAGLMDHVEECMTPVFVHASLEDGKMVFYLDVPKSSPTVRGYASILLQGLQGLTPEQLLSVPDDFYLRMGLEQVLTHQRLNGIAAILAHMKLLAAKEIDEG